MYFKNLYVGEDENTIVLKNYDTNNNGKVDVAESVDWDGIQNKPSILDGEVYTTTEKNKLASLENYVKPTNEPISYIAGLQTALDNLGASNITNLQADIDNILTLLASDDLSLDTLQEIVDFITLNKDTLDNLGINNIAGLQTALDGKAPIIHNHDTTYEPKNTNIQEHVNSISNPHAVTKIQIGLNNVPNLDTTNAVANEHTHTNKSILDAITSSFTTTLKTAYDTASSWVTTNGSNLINHLSNISNPHSVTKSQVGLGNVDNTSDINKPISDATATALNNKANIVNGVVPSSELPSYVDDVLEYDDYASLPVTGSIGKIYITLDDNRQYRWSGTVYVDITGGAGSVQEVISKTGIQHVIRNADNWLSFETGQTTGAICIEIVGLWGYDLSGDMEIQVNQNSAADGDYIDYVIKVAGNWRSSDHSWHNTKASLITATGSSLLNVRFCKDSTAEKVYIVIFDIDTVLSYRRIVIPMISVNGAMTGYAPDFAITRITSYPTTTDATKIISSVGRSIIYNLAGTEIAFKNGDNQYKTLTTATTFTSTLVNGESVVLTLSAAATYAPTFPTITWITSGGNVKPTWTALDVVVLWVQNNTLYGSYVGSGV